MKHIKKLTIFVLVVTLISMLGTCFVSAEDVENTESAERIYTFDEMLDMSADEVMEIWHKYSYEMYGQSGRNILYKYYDTFDNYARAIRGRYYNSELSNGYFSTYEYYANYNGNIYVPNLTENKIKYIFGDTIEYTISSPATRMKLNSDYTPYIEIYFPNVPFLESDELSSRLDNYRKLTNDDILYYLKMYVCLEQVITGRDFEYGAWAPTEGSSVPTEFSISMCDVNIDATVDLYDVIWITKYIAQIYEFPDGQKAVADISGDGVVNVVDAIMLAEHVNNPEENPI